MIESVLQKIGFDWQVAVANLVNFFIIFWLLYRYAFNPVKKVIEERKRTIEEAVSAVSKMRGEIAQTEVEKQALIQAAQKESQALLEEANKKRKIVIEQAKEEAIVAASLEREKIQKEIDQEKIRSLKEIEMHAQSLVSEGVKKIITARIPDETQRAIFTEAVKQSHE